MAAYIRVGFAPRALWQMRLGPDCSAYGECPLLISSNVFSLETVSPHLKVVDVDVKSPLSVFGEWVGEFLVCFTQDAMLRVL